MFQRKDTYRIPDGMREQISEAWRDIRYAGLVEADPECYLSPDCQITGRVRLGWHSMVLRGAVLRGDAERIDIGAESNIQEQCVVHVSEGFPVVVGEHSTVGHGAILHGCTIGDNSVVGMGAVVLNGARIGNNCLVGAGAVVTQGTVVPDFHVALGVPARVRGPFSQSWADANVTHYAEANLAEAEHMLAEGLLLRPTDELLQHLCGARQQS